MKNSGASSYCLISALLLLIAVISFFASRTLYAGIFLAGAAIAGGICMLLKQRKMQ